MTFIRRTPAFEKVKSESHHGVGKHPCTLSQLTMYLREAWHRIPAPSRLALYRHGWHRTGWYCTISPLALTNVRPGIACNLNSNGLS